MKCLFLTRGVVKINRTLEGFLKVFAIVPFVLLILGVVFTLFGDFSMEYINENIQRDISIDEICAAVHMSKYHFCRQFKKITGTTVMNYIKKTRVIMAKNMLINESLSVAEISNRCGFSSISYFSRIFKEETGVSPLKYKKNKS